MQRALQARRRRRMQARRPNQAAGAAAGVMAVVLLLGVIAMSAAMALLFSFYRGYTDDLPADPTTMFAKEVLGPARIYDRHGTLLYEFEDENDGLRNPVALRDVSEWVIKATIATEDASFYSSYNPGVNVRGLVRAALENVGSVNSGELQGSGGSSITQQLVKNVFIPEEERYERSVDRKVKEAALAVELTQRYSKDQILEWYLNQIQYGHRTVGIQAAARRYFGRNVDAKNLSLAQASFLAGLPQSPSRYDPYEHMDAAVDRQHEVLGLMVLHGKITPEEAEKAKGEHIILGADRVDLKAPHWVLYVRDLLVAKYGEEQFRSGGLHVYTTLDLGLNERMEQIVKDKIAFYESPEGGNCQCHNGALVLIDNNTGDILSMVGSRDYWRVDIEGKNNNAIHIKQPGSALKPFVYLSTFLKSGGGWNPSTIVYDQPTNFFWKQEPGKAKEYFRPIGPNPYWHGGVSVRTALGNSVNTTAVKAAGYAGIPQFIDLAHRMGIRSMDEVERYGVSIATGGSDITLLDLTFAYSVLANNGEMRGMPAVGPAVGEGPKPNHRKLDPGVFLKIEDGNGQVLFDIERERGRDQVVPAGYAYQITDILKDNEAKRLTYGNSEAQFGMPDKRPIAAKTGTQQGAKRVEDVLSTWNFGYTPDITIGVWVGNQDNTLVNPNLTSASSSLVIWRDALIEANKLLQLKPREFPVPKEIEFQMINGKREPIVKGQKMVCAEDLKQWGLDKDAKNPTVPTNGGIWVGPDCKGIVGGSACYEERVRDARTGVERIEYRCPTATQAPVTRGGAPAPASGGQGAAAPAAPAAGAAPAGQGSGQSVPGGQGAAPARTAVARPPAPTLPAVQPPVQQPPVQQPPVQQPPAANPPPAAGQQPCRLRFNPTALQWECEQ